MARRDHIIFLDTETTGLPHPIGTELKYQPYMTEMCAIMTDSKYDIVDEIDTLLSIPIAVPELITKMTGINDAMLKGKPTFHSIFKKFKAMCKRSSTMVAQNYCFDEAIIGFAVERINKKLKLPPEKFCTVEQSLHLKGRRLKLAELYPMATGKVHENAHRAKTDVLAMIEVYKFITGDQDANTKGRAEAQHYTEQR